LHKIHKVPGKRQSFRISRQKTALTDTLKNTQAVSSADRVQCLALLKYRQLIQQSTARAKFRHNSLKNTHKQTIINQSINFIDERVKQLLTLS